MRARRLSTHPSSSLEVLSPNHRVGRLRRPLFVHQSDSTNQHRGLGVGSPSLGFSRAIFASPRGWLHRLLVLAAPGRSTSRPVGSGRQPQDTAPSQAPSSIAGSLAGVFRAEKLHAIVSPLSSVAQPSSLGPLAPQRSPLKLLAARQVTRVPRSSRSTPVPGIRHSGACLRTPAGLAVHVGPTGRTAFVFALVQVFVSLLCDVILAMTSHEAGGTSVLPNNHRKSSNTVGHCRSEWSNQKQTESISHFFVSVASDPGRCSLPRKRDPLAIGPLCSPLSFS